MDLKRRFQYALSGLIAAASIMLAGCGGPALLRDAKPLESSGPLLEAGDDRIVATIDQVILPDGPGAWAKNAEWDEYLVRVRTRSDEPVEIREVVIFDAYGERREARADRGALVEGSRAVERRYAQAGWGRNDRGVPTWVTVAGVGTAGSAAIAASAAPGFAGMAAIGAAAAMATGVGVVLAGAGVVKLVNNAKVDNEIQRRHTALPVALQPGADQAIGLFYPVAPQSDRMQVVYADRHGEHRLDIAMQEALARLERDMPVTPISRERPRFPDEARRQRIRKGHVIARLTIDPHGRVQDVELVEAVPPGLFEEEARRTFATWRYNNGRVASRTTEERMEFRRDPGAQ